MVFIGFFGCGKLMFLCCINWMNDLVEGMCVEGEVKLYGKNIYYLDVDVLMLCCWVGMVF